MKEIGEEMTIIREQRVRIDRSEVEGEGLSITSNCPMTLFDYNSTELLVKNKSVHPPIIFKKTVMHSHNNLEIILLQLDRKFKNSFFSGLCCLFLFHFPFLVIFLSILAAITYFLYWYIID
ncbi:uncharacterized protein LOC113670297 [Pocillopora damicornis]|uniref:uncharacterized protein LOC113670297 n=1 Tax=Pocillopora damicornis TaxID=46731 RepID=UPI000F552026|nr:uncharacterized protein LOC113670297 [Pocillopora damicornis]